jgi:DNA-binding NtrC family response regulator
MSVFHDLLIGNSYLLQEAINTASILSATDTTALICGESGTGKELIAKGIHRASPRRRGPLISINCAALPDTLAESLLFGHQRGAFTGATTEHNGYIRSAHGGTLFLDEIGELSPGLQSKLLRFIESGECMPLGSTLTCQPDVRIVAATHRDLREEVEKGRFREDLFYRLYIVPIQLPPLRERREDIPLLLRHFAKHFAIEFKQPSIRFSNKAISTLRAYRWQGNIRELRNIVQRLSILLPGQEVDLANLPAEITQTPLHESARQQEYLLPKSGIDFDQLEKCIIHQALMMTMGNQSKAARLIGLSRDTFVYRQKKYAITPQ